MADEVSEARYVYGVMRSSSAGELGGRGIADEPLDLVRHEELAALTSAVPDGPLEAGRGEIEAHARALEQAFEHGMVLPMRFGTVMRDEATVREDLLEAHREELESQLDATDRKVEVNVKGIYDEPLILGELVAENSEIARLKEAVSQGSEDATYPERIRLGELIAEGLEAKREAESEAIAERLSRHADDVDLGALVHERMAVNASFLVARDNLEAFDRELDEIAAEQGERIRFKYTGPLPPHSFVELSLEA